MTSNRIPLYGVPFAVFIAILTILLTITGCRKTDIVAPPSGGGTPYPTSTPGFIPPDINDVNVIKFGINDIAYCSNFSYTNKPCMNVTVCSADGSNCAVISDILIDTGSYGLRIFKQKFTGQNLTASPAGDIAECMEYGDGSKQWGPIKIATVKLGNEPAVQLPIHVIDSTHPGEAAECSGSERDASEAGFNGILGIGVFQSDCGPYCANNANNNIYFRNCNGGGCTSTTVSLNHQVQNPIGLFPIDNNGVMLKIPSLPAGGKPSEVGYIVFGVNTRANNNAQGKTVLQTDSNYGEITTEFNGNSYRSFIDSGSNAFGIPVGRTLESVLPDCGGSLSGWLCPTSTYNGSAQMIGENGQTKNVNFKVGNFAQLFGTGNGNAVFSETAYLSGANISGFFAWGLPFYYGREIYLGIENRSSPVGSGTYWAF